MDQQNLAGEFPCVDFLFSITLEAEEEMRSYHCLIKTWPIIRYGGMMMPARRNLLLKSYFRDAKSL